MSAIAYFGHSTLFSVASTVYFLFTLLSLRARTPAIRAWVTNLLIALPVLVIHSPAHLFHFGETLVSLLSFLSFFLGILAGYFFFILGPSLRLLPAMLLIFINLFFWTVGAHLWFNFVNYGFFRANMDPIPVPAFMFTDASGKPFNDPGLKTRVLVLDFWNTSCPACFHAFPNLEKEYRKYKGDERIRFLSVNVPLKSDTTGQWSRMLAPFHYSFPQVTSTLTTGNDFGVRYYPTVIIIAQNKMVFHGSLDDACKVLPEYLHRQ
ncbi:TlpA family protein disulfide reductase [Hufsiella ginkgonis]|uniref:TlpA family protein disulfide reductase n=1 Tax=Hufsiella ginkgonis TaxID=2695274 RepID=UPI0034E24901